MKSIDVRIVLDRDLTEPEAERVGRRYARAVEAAMVDGRIPRQVAVAPNVIATAQDVRRAPRPRS